MYCLRTYIPLLLLPLPLSLSPIHLTTLLVLTYILNRPCIYCSFLLLVLFGSSCAWQGGRCFWSVDTYFLYPPTGSIQGGVGIGGNETMGALVGEEAVNWILYFLPRLYTTPSPFAYEPSSPDSNSTISTLLTSLSNTSIVDDVKRKLLGSGYTDAGTQISNLGLGLGQGIGTQWLKNLLGRSEWTLPCVGVKVVV